jgi:hypothetical protein
VRYLSLFPIACCNMAAVTSLCEGLYLLTRASFLFREYSPIRKEPQGMEARGNA